MSDSRIVVIDIGKTNKKVVVFDSDLNVCDSVFRSFDEKVRDGIHYEDVENAWAWIKEQLAAFAQKYPVKTISVTTHGATAMCIKNDGSLAAPPVAYTTDAGHAFSDDFFAAFGDRKELQQTTATAEIGNMINVGKLLYFIKKCWPDSFTQTDMVLYYPQYIGYLLTGKAGAEPTYTGCHTYLYDFVENRPSAVAEKLDVVSKMPREIRNSWAPLGCILPEMAKETGLSEDCIVTMGIHDSNASLLPYLVKGYNNFTLNSTGTWCVAMHPTNKVTFAPDELGKLVFYNLDAFFHPVKTSIFMGGLEFETYTEALFSINGRRDFPSFDQALYSRILQEQELFILPSVVRGTGIFPDSPPRVIEKGEVYELGDIINGVRIPAFFKNFETAYAVCNISLALQTQKAIDMAGFSGEGRIFTEGGFRKNEPYNALLAALYPQSQCALTDLAEATAFGAAICGKAALEDTTPMACADCFSIESIDAPKASLQGLPQYAAQFDQALRKG